MINCKFLSGGWGAQHSLGLTSYAKEQIYSENAGVPKDQIHEVVRDVSDHVLPRTLKCQKFSSGDFFLENSFFRTPLQGE